MSSVAGYAMGHGLTKDELIPLVRQMTAGLVERELHRLNHEAITAGEKLSESRKTAAESFSC